MGISENVGHDMNFSILNETTNKVISRHNVRPVGEPPSPSLRMDPLTAPEVVTSRHTPSDYLEDNEEAPTNDEDEPSNASTSPPKHAGPILDPNDLVGVLLLFHKKMFNVYELE